MGNLTLTTDDPPDFRKGIISIWFRIPAATRAEVAARVDPSLEQYDPLLKVIPLLTWGPQPEQVCALTDSEVVNYPVPAPCAGPDVPLIVQSLAGDTVQLAGPSYIGVHCWDDGHMTLEVNIQTTDHPSCVGTSAIATDWVWTVPSEGCEIPYPGCDPILGMCIGVGYVAVETDVSSTDEQTLEYFGNRTDVGRGGVSGWSGRSGQPVISGTDKWHHVILSWDLTAGSSSTGWNSNTDEPLRGYTSLGVSTYSLMWCSVDDVNQAGFDLPAMWPFYDGGVEGDANASMSYTPFGVAAFANQIDGSPSTAAVTVSAVAFNPFCIPSALSVVQTSAGTVVPNLKVDMAELQVFAGVTLDTSVEANRRLFVTSDGRPELDYTIVEAELEKAPEIRLHGTKNWRRGTNTGTRSNFIPSGTINRFDPGPSLT